jgi:hypothetical protein
MSPDCFHSEDVMPVLTLVCLRQVFDELPPTEGAYLSGTTRHIQRLYYVGSPVVGVCKLYCGM